jgi:hypothetical protein
MFTLLIIVKSAFIPPFYQAKETSLTQNVKATLRVEFLFTP